MKKCFFPLLFFFLVCLTRISYNQFYHNDIIDFINEISRKKYKLIAKKELLGFWETIKPDNSITMEFKKNGIVFFGENSYSNSEVKLGRYKFVKYFGSPLLMIKFPNEKKYIGVFYLKDKQLIISGKLVIKPKFELWGKWVYSNANESRVIEIRNFYRFVEKRTIDNKVITLHGYVEVKKKGHLKYIKLNYEKAFPNFIFISMDKYFNTVLKDSKNRIFKKTSHF